MTVFSTDDCALMARALRLAERGRYSAHPNPVVGCVIAHGAEIVGEGWHVRAGEAHAEVNALSQAGGRARGATVYVSLEPCAHQGKTPPCTTALVDAGVARVVVAMGDPFPEVAGKGLEILAAAGVAIDTGLMSSTAASLNEGFLGRITCQRPLVRVKLGASIDGAIAMSSGESQWITGPESRRDVQRLRARCGAILTGIGTVLADDPSLNVRDCDPASTGVQPLRVVLDSKLRMPVAAGMLALPGTTLVCCTDSRNAALLRDTGAVVKSFPEVDGGVDVRAVLQELAEREINEVLVEAGPRVAGHLLEQKLVDELVIYQAPHIMGSQTLRLLATPSWTTLADRQAFSVVDRRRVGADTRLTLRP